MVRTLGEGIGEVRKLKVRHHRRGEYIGAVRYEDLNTRINRAVYSLNAPPPCILGLKKHASLVLTLLPIVNGQTFVRQNISN